MCLCVDFQKVVKHFVCYLHAVNIKLLLLHAYKYYEGVQHYECGKCRSEPMTVWRACGGDFISGTASFPRVIETACSSFIRRISENQEGSC